MDQQRSRIQEDLRGLLSGDVRCDDVTVQLYASDASIYQIKPLGVVLPRSTQDVVACVKYAQENCIPVHARGAGSGLAGQCLGPGLVIDFSKHLRRVLHTGPDSVRVQPGLVHERLNYHLRRFGRTFGPDPTLSSVTTIGGCIAVDSGGSHFPRYGSVRRHVISLQVVLADGAVLELGQEQIPLARPPQENGEIDRQRELLEHLAVILRREQKLIQDHQPKSLVNCSGYDLTGVLHDGHLNMAKLLTGSEGTLALITEATLATQPLPKHKAVALLFFDQLDKAARAALEIVSFNPSACDLMDRRHLSLARETNSQYEPLIPAAAEAMLLVEADGEEAVDVRQRLLDIVDRVRRQERLAFESSLAFDQGEIDLCWQLALKVVPTLYRLKGSTRPLPFMEDFAIPPETLPRFLIRMQNVLKLHQVTASLFSHAAHGQIHLRPFMDLADPDEHRRIQRLAADMYEAVWEVGGTISGEHGDGLSRTSFVPRQYGPLYRVFHEVKRVFDPLNIFNPGKIVGGDADLVVRNLRPVAISAPQPEISQNGQPDAPTEATEPSDVEPADVVELQLTWTPEEMAYAAHV